MKKESIIQMKKKLKGRHLSPKTEFKKGHSFGKRFKKGHTPWNKGKKIWNNKEHPKGMLGKNHTSKSKRKISKANIGNTKGFKKGMKGILSPAYKHGRTKEFKLIRNSSDYIKWREQVLERDNYTCQNPNCEFCNNQIGILLNTHHIKSFTKYPELRFEISNGLTLCEGYHVKGNIHGGDSNF